MSEYNLTQFINKKIRETCIRFKYDKGSPLVDSVKCNKHIVYKLIN